MKFKIGMSIIGILLIGIVFLGFKYFDTVLLVNDMQFGIDYRDKQIKTLQSLFMSAASETSRPKIVHNINKNFDDNAIIKEFDDRIEANEIVVIFDKETIKSIVTINEYSVMGSGLD
ncbi:MAG: hypothetical protein GY729_12715 [Desulfobacteraceae bacterium]|nr:hypothetical protein [Desulfobacteraceae bacterium]